MSAGVRRTAYSKADDAASSREERLARLKTELREHIRFLSDYDLLSSDWLRMAESMHQIANVAFMETSLPLIEENPVSSLPPTPPPPHLLPTPRPHSPLCPLSSLTAAADWKEGSRHSVGPGEGRVGRPYPPRRG